MRITEPIVVTFSEPMNTASGDVAYAPEEIPTEPWVTSWSADGTVLTIDAKLTYPTGADPTTIPNKVHRFTISANARDLAGNPLDAPANGEFTLARHALQQLYIITGAPNCGNVVTATGGGAYTFIAAGEGTTLSPHTGYATFDITSVADSVLEWQSAKIKGSIRGIAGDPSKYGTTVDIEHIFFNDINDDVPTTPTLHAVGTLFSLVPLPAIDDPVELDVLTSLQDDLVNRVARLNKSQYRLIIPGFTAVDGDGVADYIHIYNAANTTHIEASYLLASTP